MDVHFNGTGVDGAVQVVGFSQVPDGNAFSEEISLDLTVDGQAATVVGEVNGKSLGKGRKGRKGNGKGKVVNNAGGGGGGGGGDRRSRSRSPPAGGGGGGAGGGAGAGAGVGIVA